MITLSEAVEEQIIQTPFLEEALAQGLVNTSALARQLQPTIEKRLYKHVTPAALTMAIIRFAKTLQSSPATQQTPKVENITVRSELVEYTFANSPTLMEQASQISWLAFSEGAQETTFIASQKQAAEIEKLLASQYLKSKIEGLSAITLSLPTEIVHQPGSYYQILKLLAWHNVNLIEIISSFTELTFILQKAEIDRAFSILNKLA